VHFHYLKDVFFWDMMPCSSSKKKTSLILTAMKNIPEDSGLAQYATISRNYRFFVG
jgi:hypothetical protein